MLTGNTPDNFYARLMDVLLILHADHECNASTFSMVVVRSTLSDLYSCVVAGIGALKGPLHGGANEEVMRMLQAIGSLDNVEKFLEDAMSQRLRISGFGHRVYKTMDPRAAILREHAREVTRRAGTEHWLETAERIEKIMAEKYGQRGIWPNVDFFSGVVMASMGIEPAIFTPIFAVGRSAGWVSHIIEQGSGQPHFPPALHLRRTGKRTVPANPRSEEMSDRAARHAAARSMNPKLMRPKPQGIPHPAPAG